MQERLLNLSVEIDVIVTNGLRKINSTDYKSSEASLFLCSFDENLPYSSIKIPLKKLYLQVTYLTVYFKPFFLR